MDNILEKIYKAGLKFMAPSTPQDTYATILSEAMKLVGADTGAIYLEEQKKFKAVYASDPQLYSLHPRKKANTYKAFKTQTPILVNNMFDLKKAHPQLKNKGLKSALFIPLTYQNKAIGVLTVNSTSKKVFTQKELGILKLFGSMAIMAIRKTQLYDETKKALETRDKFISLASHELRTPLTAVNGYIQLLHHKLGNKDGVESKWMNQLLFESNRLTNLVKELLEINRIKTGELHYSWEECSMRKVIKQAINNSRLLHPERKLFFKNDLQESDKVIGDYNKLVQALDNLLNNAVKFSTADSSITVTLNSKQNSFLCVGITDQGVGISRKERKKVFEAFYKENPENQKEGLGLGLFLVKDVLERHQGKISLKSAQKKGTTVELRLPKAKL